MTRARVVALGRPLAGDDGVGAAVLSELRRRSPRGIELRELRDPIQLVELLLEPGRVVVVDAIADEPAGIVVVLRTDQLPPTRGRALAPHSFDLSAAIELAAALATATLDVRIVGVTVGAADFAGQGLASAVAAAVPVASELVLRATGTGSRASPARGTPGTRRRR